MIRAVLFLLLAAALTAFTLWVYARRELPVRSGRILAGLRASALVLLLLLLFDPRLPWGGNGADGARWVLLDASLSMAVPGSDGVPPWTAARARAEALAAEGWTPVAFGGDLTGELPDVPGGAASRLAPVLERALEAGASQVVVLSDFRLQDPVEVEALLASAPLGVRFESFGATGVNVGVGAFDVEDAPRRGRPVPASVELFGEGADSVVLEFREEDRLVDTRTVRLPQAGLRRRVEVELPAPEAEGRVRFTVRAILPGDATPDDDEAVAYATAGYEEGALVLISLVPDWEPRYLLPVLEEVTGLEGAGYLRVGPARFAPMGRGGERGEPVDSAVVGRAATDAAVLVIHGLSGSADAWSAGLAGRSARVLAWPLDAAAAARLGVSTGGPRPGEWYAAPDVPPSPLAGELAGAPLGGLPPLADLLVPGGSEGGVRPLLLQLGGTGPGEPALVLLRPQGRRVAVPLARGFWRWAARGGDARTAYRRLWSGVAGWLLTPDRSVAAAELRPVNWVVERGGEVRWRVPDGGPVRLELLRGDEVMADTTFQEAGEASTGTLPPGSYRYRALDADGATTAEGRFDVAGRTAEMAASPTIPDLDAARERAGTAGAVDAGRPLRTSPWPWLLVLLLLAAEWVGRRRAGLR